MSDEEEPMGLADAFMMRGEELRKLRLLAEADEAERDSTFAEHDSPTVKKREVDQIDVLPNGKTVLRYNSYLKHQRYYDDLKHVDCSFLDYGIVTGGGRLIVEQDKRLGKGGLCWDAAYILAEHLVASMQEWRIKPPKITRMVELGSGTGLCGLMVAKCVQDCHVNITDLPELMDLMRRNVELNFSTGAATDDALDDDSRKALYTYEGTVGEGDFEGAKLALGRVSASVLRWGIEEDYREAPYDIVVGADVVASLYDPVALAYTLHALCHEKSTVYVSYKGRLTGPHEQFEAKLGQLFRRVERIQPRDCRNRNPDVFILKATGKETSVAFPP